MTSVYEFTALAMDERPSWTWFSFVRRTRAIGGAFDGVEMTSGPFQMNDKIERGSNLLASADTRILTIRDRHDLVIEDDTAGIEELCVVLVLNLMTQVFNEKASQAARGRSTSE